MTTDIDTDSIQWSAAKDSEAADVWSRVEMDLGDVGIQFGTYDQSAKLDSDRFAFRISTIPNDLTTRTRIVIVTMCWDADVGDEGKLRDCSYVLRVEVRR